MWKQQNSHIVYLLCFLERFNNLILCVCVCVIWQVLSHPTFHAHAFDRGAFPVLRPPLRSGQRPQRWGVEVWPVVLPVTAIVRAAWRADAVGRGTPHLWPGGRGRGVGWGRGRVLGHEAWLGHTVSRRGNGLWLDVDVLVGVDGEVRALRYVVARPDGRRRGGGWGQSLIWIRVAG